MGVKRKRGKERCACRAWVNFARRAAYMLVVLFVAAVLVANFGGESFSMLGFVKDAAGALAEAAGEAFGENG
jgi:hypothetical protein